MMKTITLKCGAGSVTIPAEYDPKFYLGRIRAVRTENPVIVAGSPVSPGSWDRNNGEIGFEDSESCLDGEVFFPSDYEELDDDKPRRL